MKMMPFYCFFWYNTSYVHHISYRILYMENCISWLLIKWQWTLWVENMRRLRPLPLNKLDRATRDLTSIDKRGKNIVFCTDKP